MVDPSNLDSLTKRCTEVLGRYIRQAERAYALLGAIKRHPVSEEERQQLRAQRVPRIPLKVERRFSDPVRLESGWGNLRKGEPSWRNHITS